VRLINDDEIPRDPSNVYFLIAGKLIGADEDSISSSKGRWIPCLYLSIERFRFQNFAWKEKLLCQFLLPLLAEIGRGDHQNLPSPFSPLLGNDQPSFNSFTQTHFICEQRSL
jgi:hypothetical protein